MGKVEQRHKDAAKKWMASDPEDEWIELENELGPLAAAYAQALADAEQSSAPSEDDRSSEHDYPLYCLEVDPECEIGYEGPWPDKEAAEKKQAVLGGEVRRCRRADPALLIQQIYDLDWLLDAWDEVADEELANALDESWAVWDDVLVELKPGAKEAFVDFVQKYVNVKVYELQPRADGESDTTHED